MKPTSPLYPLHFQPILKRLIWGGRRLQTLLDKALGPEEDYAESWEISDHGDDVSRVADGPLRGTTLRELLADRAADILGTNYEHLSQFPLLIKFIDAHQVLSVQVHPDDERAPRLANDQGKTEAWVLLHADPGSVIYAGLRPGVTRKSFAEAIRSGQVEALLHRFPARAGDCVFVPAGTVHAIGAGVLLAEVQQMSDATFRVYDWGRVGSDGSPRTLHVAQALESIDFQRGPVDPITPMVHTHTWGIEEELVNCSHFRLERMRLSQTCSVGSSDRFTIVMGLEGHVQVVQNHHHRALRKGETLLLPACLGPCQMTPTGEASVLVCSLP